MDLIEEFHAKDHLEVIHGHDRKMKVSTPRPKCCVHALYDTRNRLGGRVHHFYGASFLVVLRLKRLMLVIF